MPESLGTMGRQAECFRMRVRAVADVVVVELHGELDLVADARLTPRMDTLTCRERPAIVMDLGGVTFMDARGLQLLTRAGARVRERGGTLRVVPDTRWVAMLLRLTGTGAGFSLLERLPPSLT
jgi:anti-anti-sigma factor